MLIRQHFQILFIALSFSMLLAVALAVRSLATVDDLIAIETRSVESLKLADELRQSSDDLTRMARSFAATGDPRFEAYFNEILAIRAGDAPYPDGYQGIFWDFVVHDGARRGGDTPASALLERMRALGFSEEEFEKLADAQARSNQLVRLETAAMNAVKGRFDDGTGSYPIAKAPDRAVAIRMLFSDNYHAAKADIMQPVAEFFELLEARTSRELEQSRGDHSRQIKLATAAMVLALGLTVYGYFLLNSRVVSPLTSLRTAIAAFKDSPQRQSIPDLPRRDEVGEIAAQLKDSSRAIADHIDHVNDARDRLERSQAQLETVLENVNQGIVMYDAQCRLTAWNRRYQALLGFDDELMVVGRPLMELMLTMRPCDSMISGAKALVTRTTPKTLTSKTKSMVQSSNSTSGSM